MQLLDGKALAGEARVWVPRETYLREKMRAERAEAIAVRLHQARRVEVRRVALPAADDGTAATVLGLCLFACTATFGAMMTLPFMMPPLG